MAAWPSALSLVWPLAMAAWFSTLDVNLDVDLGVDSVDICVDLGVDFGVDLGVDLDVDLGMHFGLASLIVESSRTSWIQAWNLIIEQLFLVWSGLHTALLITSASSIGYYGVVDWVVASFARVPLEPVQLKPALFQLQRRISWNSQRSPWRSSLGLSLKRNSLELGTTRWLWLPTCLRRYSWLCALFACSLPIWSPS